MKYINGLDSEHADETCPKNEKVLWTCLRGFPKITVVTLYTSKDFCLRFYTETGGIFDMPFRAYIIKEPARVSDNETVAEIVKEIRQIGPYAVYKKPIFRDATAVSVPYVKRLMYGQFVTDFGTIRLENPKVKEVSNYELADRIEAAYRREMEHQAVHNCELRAKSGLCGLRDEIKAHRREVAELRECLKEAIAGILGQCRSRWPCKMCGNDKCKAKRWRKALEGKANV